ncbi:MAG: sensor histidine kinase [bacterium]
MVRFFRAGSSSISSYGAIICAVFAILYYNRFREREVAASELAVQLSQAQLRALRMQLNPHFLFNALNTIAMLVRKEDGDAAVKMLAGLSDLLRYALDDDAAHEVPLAGELAFLERYLAIERTRFRDRLRVTVDVDADVFDALVPNLILQPLVENAVRYGVAPRAAGGAIRISASRTGSELVLTVSDDGPGLANEASMSVGVGFTNTRERLTRLYGEPGKLTFANASAGGAVVTITIPWHTRPIVAELAP